MAISSASKNDSTWCIAASTQTFRILFCILLDPNLVEAINCVEFCFGLASAWSSFAADTVLCALPHFEAFEQSIFWKLQMPWVVEIAEEGKERKILRWWNQMARLAASFSRLYHAIIIWDEGSESEMKLRREEETDFKTAKLVKCYNWIHAGRGEGDDDWESFTFK